MALDGPMNVAVDAVDPYELDHSVPLQGCRHRGLHAREPQGDPGIIGEPSDLGHLGRALRVDEVDPLAVEHQRLETARGTDDVAHLVLEGVRGGEEEIAVEPDDGDAGG